MTNPPRIILIDLDDTIYPVSLGLWPLFTTRIHTYMRDRVGIPENEITTTRDRLFEQYGTTMRGLPSSRTGWAGPPKPAHWPASSTSRCCAP